MTLINSCCPKSFSHLILLFSTITATTVPSSHLYQPGTSERSAAAGDDVTAVIGYDRKADNNRHDNLFDIKTEVNNLLFHSHGNLQPSTITRKRRDTIVPPSNTSATPKELSTENLILNLSFANLTNFSVNFSAAIRERVASLNLSHNHLSHFDSSKLTKLKLLELSHNNFSSIRLEGVALLETLDLSENSLASFECVDCWSLETLNLSRNQLKNVTLDSLGKLALVDLSANELSEIDSNLFHNKSNLSDVILACNRIRIINKDLFLPLLSLRRLDLSYNDISDIESETFSNLLNLQIFDLSYNRIHIASLQSLQSIADLARLSLAGNELLRNALRGFAVTWSIMELDYSHVGLCQVPDSLAQSVRILNLYGNFVNTICSGDFDSYPLLHKLVMSNNNLTAIEVDALGRLEMLTILKLDNNQLTQIPASLPSSLIKLFLHNNRISDINPSDLINLINLQVLDVSGNRIIYMPQLALPALITLSVRSCGLENVHRQISKTCPSLRHLLIDGNLIKCSELMEVEQCNENSEALANEYINDDIEHNQDDAEREERHLNSISYFHNDDGVGSLKCKRRKPVEGALMPKEAVPNCWNEQKLITSFISTNDSTSATTPPPPSTTASNDNKFPAQSTHKDVTKGSTEWKNDGNLSSETMKINNNTTMAGEITVREKVVRTKQPNNWQSGVVSAKSEKMKNLKARVGEKPMIKAAKLALPVNVAKSEIKPANTTTNVDKILSAPESFDALRQKGLNRSLVMETKQIKAAGTVADGLKADNSASSNSNNSQTNPKAAGNHTAMNRNQIDYVSADYGRVLPLAKTIPSGEIKAIKDNESPEESSATSKSKSIDEVRRRDNNKSRNGSVNALPLVGEMSASMAAAVVVPGGQRNSGNGNIDATDHEQQHMAINHTMPNGEQSERWNDIRGETINHYHPGLLIVIAISAGILFTFVVVYVYRCDFISSARRRRRRGSCETINEGRDVLNDNFNEETHSFTIEAHNHGTSSLTASPASVNQCDLLPMDILNSTLNQSSDTSHISVHLW